MKVRVIALVVVAAMLTSCATLMKGNTERVRFRSEPAGAVVFVNGQEVGATPVSLKLESRKRYVIEFVKPGYQKKVYNINNHVGPGWIVLDVVLGVLPVVVDAVTGSWYSLDQTNINAILERQQSRI
ncbi:MAG: PEGA domain-containing protein [Candidatus Aminicenantes bacterium]|nr:PEGA domain-containing protein [Candidatus Aminicenantes bacterium]